MLEKLLNIFFKLFRIKNDKIQDNITQFVKFGIVGFSNVAVSYVINILVLLVLKKHELAFDYVIANLVAFLLSVLWSFYWNNKYVFKNEKDQKRNLLISLIKTYIAYSFSCIILNNIFSWIWIELLGISKYIAPMINLIITVPINYIINKLWAFN